jgi:hypothetical protein
VAVDEHILAQTERREELRAETRRTIDDAGLTAAPDSVTDSAERRRLRAQLLMFGEPDVRQAYDRSGEANKQFVMAVIAYRHAANLNLRAETGGRSSAPVCRG